MDSENLIIIGSGPAGYTAAIYAARAKLSPLLIEGSQPGGQLMLTTEVENFPGFPDGIMGPELMRILRKQAERFGCRFEVGNVTEIDIKSDPKIVKVGDKEFETKAVIFATGAAARWLNVPGEDQYKGRGVSACATCDGFFFKDKDVVVVGGGDSAMEEATFLTSFVNKVTVLVRKNEVKASAIMKARAEKDPKISFMFNTEVKEVLGDGKKMTGLVLVNSKTKDEVEMDAQGLFVAIGRKPSTELLEGQVELTKGYIATQCGTTRTAVPGFFAAGDVRDWVYRQAVWAAGDGCAAALDAKRFLDEQE
ncbi:MAG: thioredoxin-disulfide reductase [Candidatus Uhrbacteria bacterium]|nr:thioredoxin-disulfide reductase [Patescibacteria group bacterium]MBU1906868.1 thioredoxin-disulfide reductase [Patescibacteria group bacterium]